MAHKSITAFLSENSFQILSQESHWRHLIWIVQKKSKKYFIKEATSIEVSEKTQNEVAWNQQVQNHLPVKIPKIIETGFTENGCFWYLSEHIEGKSLHEPFLRDFGLLAKNIPTVLATIQAISKLKNLDLPKDKNIDLEHKKSSLFDKVKTWQSKINQNTNDLLVDFKSFVEKADYNPQHGDCVPNHFLFDTKNILWLVDGEHATSFGLPYYDLAYFYHRLYTKHRSPELANQMLKQVESLNTHLFLGMLAGRLIGGMYDAEFDQGQTDKNLHQDLLNLYRNHSIL